MADYDPVYKFPADIQECENHRLANRIFKGKKAQQDYDFHKCECCGRSIGEHHVKLPYCYDPVKELIFLGPGVPLLFILNRISIILLLLLTLVFGIYAIISNYNGNSCQQTPNCDGSIFVQLSLANKIFDPRSVDIQNYLLMGFELVFIVFLQFLIYQVRKTTHITDELINSPSDYALMISQLPQGWKIQDVVELITDKRLEIDYDQQSQTNNLSIHDVIFSFQLSQYYGLKEEDQQEFMKAKKEDPKCNYRRMRIDMPNKLAHFVIILFDRQASKNLFDEPDSCYKSIRNFLCNCTLCLTYSKYQVNREQVVVERAPQPDDILWKNADKPRNSIIRNKIISYIASLALLVLSGYIQYELERQKNSITDSLVINIYNVVSSLSLAIFNGILSLFLVFMTEIEGDLTQTHMNGSLLIKVAVFEFFNAGIFNIAARILAEQTDTFNIHGNSSYEITLLVAINAIATTSANLFITITQFPKGIKRWMFKKGWLEYNQKRANQIFERKQPQFPLRYAFIIYIIWMGCFYAAFVPIVVPICMLGLVFFEIVQQFLFKNKYSIPFMLSQDIADVSISLLRYTGLVTLSGSFSITIFISYKLNAQFTINQAIPFILGLIISITTILLPSTAINEKLFDIEKKGSDPPDYDQASRQFTVTYKQTHPLTTHALKMTRGEIVDTNFNQLIQMKTIHHSSHHHHNSGVKVNHESLKWRSFDQDDRYEHFLRNEEMYGYNQ